MGYSLKTRVYLLQVTARWTRLAGLSRSASRGSRTLTAEIVKRRATLALTQIRCSSGSIRIAGVSRSGGLNGGGGVVVGEARVLSFEQWPECVVEGACPDL
jgi:hypothetical protein